MYENSSFVISITVVYSVGGGVLVSDVGLINKVNQRWAQLVLGWVTIFGWETI